MIQKLLVVALMIITVPVGISAQMTEAEKENTNAVEDNPSEVAIQLVSKLTARGKGMQSIGDKGSSIKQSSDIQRQKLSTRASAGDAEAAQMLKFLGAYTGQGWEANSEDEHLWKVEYWESLTNMMGARTNRYYWLVDTKKTRIKPLTITAWGQLAASGGGDPYVYAEKHPDINPDSEINSLPWFEPSKDSNGKWILKKIVNTKQPNKR